MFMPPQQLLPRWIGGLRQRSRGFAVLSARYARQPLAGPFYRAETPSQDSAEAVAVVRIRGRAAVVQLACDLRAGRLAAFRQECCCELFRAIGRRGLRVRQPLKVCVFGA